MAANVEHKEARADDPFEIPASFLSWNGHSKVDLKMYNLSAGKAGSKFVICKTNPQIPMWETLDAAARRWEDTKEDNYTRISELVFHGTVANFHAEYGTDPNGEQVINAGTMYKAPDHCISWDRIISNATGMYLAMTEEEQKDIDLDRICLMRSIANEFVPYAMTPEENGGLSPEAREATAAQRNAVTVASLRTFKARPAVSALLNRGNALFGDVADMFGLAAYLRVQMVHLWMDEARYSTVRDRLVKSITASHSTDIIGYSSIFYRVYHAYAFKRLEDGYQYLCDHNFISPNMKLRRNASGSGAAYWPVYVKAIKAMIESPCTPAVVRLLSIAIKALEKAVDMTLLFREYACLHYNNYGIKEQLVIPEMIAVKWIPYASMVAGFVLSLSETDPLAKSKALVSPSKINTSNMQIWKNLFTAARDKVSTFSDVIKEVAGSVTMTIGQEHAERVMQALALAEPHA
jgi:hypothetical protein